VARDAGHRTADYRLANRIPGPVQWALKPLPPALASRILLSAIAKHAFELRW
jgi:divinyl protochlorophyllide a 8-vinyl-reductase